nr:MAG TPA: hypothetical protein [Caudoviricetes sp.]
MHGAEAAGPANQARMPRAQNGMGFHPFRTRRAEVPNIASNPSEPPQW